MIPPDLSQRRRTLFVERQTYRRRRLRDAARLLPILGLLLFSVPLLWPAGADDGAVTSNAIKYVFGVWAALVLAAFLLSLRLEDTSDAAAPSAASGLPPDSHGDGASE